MPPSGDYWLRIALAAARATANKTKMQNESTLLTISMAVAVRWYYTTHIAKWSRSMAFIKATKRRHWVSTVPTVVAMVAWAAAAATVHEVLRMNQEGLVISQDGWIGFVVG
jgi:hypothetical protein